LEGESDDEYRVHRFEAGQKLKFKQIINTAKCQSKKKTKSSARKEVRFNGEPANFQKGKKHAFKSQHCLNYKKKASKRGEAQNLTKNSVYVHEVPMGKGLGVLANVAESNFLITKKLNIMSSFNSHQVTVGF